MMQRLDRIFDLRYGHSLELNALVRVEPPQGVNFVSRSLRNNGVSARVTVDVEPAQAGEISVALGGTPLASFVQPEPFVCGRDVMILRARNPAMSLAEKLWWARCIWENRYRYSYGRQANRTLGSLLVPSEVPDWVYSVQLPSHEGLAKPASDRRPFIDPTGPGWRDFALQDLFDIVKGRRVTKADRTAGTTRFVGASESNNGITDLADLPPIFPAGTLTVVYNGNSVGNAFYQDEPYFACDDVNVLMPKHAMSRWVQLFIAAVIKHGRTRFTYGYKWTLARMKATTVRLPVDKQGKPDFAYMEDFMRGLPFSAAVEAAAKAKE
ncbi:restriction endonuclease subunit S [Vulcaniibacterium tengchongense]|uniref:Type I restriction modification DNA specificity protein n=1 Tax=Vulcaniibacterium tengchongense TaxID=1273429 RepID=A0A3N4UXF3_9GAMM|nr:restriction endonuclease subunit S [Vulcaniibacterium tengchongense]RPE74683.1 type I restriction modification DNA specificity protein [Vulcaniibacterium tengchongense]